MNEVVQRVDLCSYLVVAACLHAAFTTVAKLAPIYSKLTGWLALLALVLTFGIGFAELRPDTALTMLSLALVSWLAASFAGLAGMVVLPVLLALRDGWRIALSNHQNEVRRLKTKRDEERVRASWLPLPPPPPELEENPDDDLEDAMRRDKENRERVERSPLTRTQKDELLRELDVLLQTRVRGTME